MSALTRGIILHKEGEQLVIQANEAEVAHFALNASVNVAGAPTTNAVGIYQELAEHGILYDRHGREVAFVTSVQMERHQIDVTTFAHSEPTYIPGMLRYIISAEGPVR